MTPEHVDRFIDQVLVPLRDSFGLTRQDMSFVEGAPRGVLRFNGDFLVNFTDGALDALSRDPARVRSTIQAFLQAQGIRTGALSERRVVSSFDPGFSV
jgi:hypothetical protein